VVVLHGREYQNFAWSYKNWQELEEQSVLSLDHGLNNLQFKSQLGLEIFPFSRMPRLSLGPTHAFFKCMLGVFPHGVEWYQVTLQLLQTL
jgi:hypothetical protein